MNKYLLIVFLCTQAGLSAQTITIKGKVKNKDKIPVDVCFLDIYDISKDTVFINQIALTDSLFQIETALVNRYLLRFSEFGYETAEKEVTYASKAIIDIGKIVMDVQYYLLNEVVVSAKRPVFKMESGRLVVKVENSSLKNMGDANDVLSRIPGIRKINNEYNIFGKGTPAIYIDGKQIQNKEELTLLKSGDISEVSVDKNPSAAYDASARAVILITTVKRLQDQLGLQVENNSSFYRKYSNSSGISTDWKKGILSANINYKYATGGSIIKESSYRYIHNDNDIFYTNLDYKVNRNSKGHIVNGKIKLDINDKSIWGFQYMGVFTPSFDKEFHDKTQQIVESGTKYDRLINQEVQERTTLHNMSANYIYREDKNTSLTFITDYIRKGITKNTFVKEQNLASGTNYHTDLFSNNQYDIYTFNLKYQFSLWDNFVSLAGIKYAYIDNYTQNHFLEPVAGNDYSENKLTDQIAAGFFQIHKEWEKWNISAGLRYEFDAMNIDDKKNMINTKRNFSDFIPNAAVEYKPNEVVALTLNYSRRLARPSFFDLDSSISYEDSLSYISGNKNIKPAVIDNLFFNMSFWEKLSFECGYTHFKNQIFQTYITDLSVPNRVWMIPVNLDKTERLDLSLNYFLSYKSWQMNCMSMLAIPKVEVPYWGGIIKRSKPVWTFSLDNEFSLGEKWSLYQNFSFNSAGYEELMYLFPTNNLTIGLIGKLFNEKLIVKIEGTDLLNGSNWNNWEVDYLNIRSGSRGDYDMTGVKISLTYKFNTIKSNVTIQKGNLDILNRTN